MAEFKLAWWYLSANQKQALKRERLAGRFGGGPRPIYWYMQEVGKMQVGINPQGYIRRSQQEFRSLFHSVVRNMR